MLTYGGSDHHCWYRCSPSRCRLLAISGKCQWDLDSLVFLVRVGELRFVSEARPAVWIRIAVGYASRISLIIPGIQSPSAASYPFSRNPAFSQYGLCWVDDGAGQRELRGRGRRHAGKGLTMASGTFLIVVRRSLSESSSGQNSLVKLDVRVLGHGR